MSYDTHEDDMEGTLTEALILGVKKEYRPIGADEEPAPGTLFATILNDESGLRYYLRDDEGNYSTSVGEPANIESIRISGTIWIDAQHARHDPWRCRLHPKSALSKFVSSIRNARDRDMEDAKTRKERAVRYLKAFFPEGYASESEIGEIVTDLRGILDGSYTSDTTTFAEFEWNEETA